MNRIDGVGYSSWLTPVSTGRGRGVLGLPIPLPTVSPIVGDNVNESEISSEVPLASRDRGSSDSHYTQSRNPPVVSTPTPDPTPDMNGLVGQMSTIVQQIGQQLADSIISHLSSSSSVGTKHTSQSEPSDKLDQAASQALDLSQVQLVTQRKVKEPPNFRGESSDSVTINEWEEIMRNFIKKGNIKTEEQAEEILIHLRGRAKDVVKFGIRNSDINIHNNPDAIYCLLRRHFSCSRYSPVPLADFYTTLPKEQEDPYEYWLRLNRAADIAIECLKEQGKVLDNPSMEVTRMFIRNCPSKDLALTFRSKTIDKWSAHEVQEVLNEYHSELSLKAEATVHKGFNDRLSVNRVEVASSPVSPPDRSERQSAGASDSSALERVINMLEKVLLQSPTLSQPSTSKPTDSKLPKIEALNVLPCSVCHDAAHSAFNHCWDNKLCFQCYSPGHTRRDCPERTAARRQPVNSAICIQGRKM